MGNSLGGKDKKTTKVMKITGETIKLKTPVKAEEVVKDYPRHVLLESEAVKHFGVRAKPLQPHQNLDPKRLYFLVELPDDAAKAIVPRRVRSDINMSAKDRLESLMLARRSASDLSIMKPVTSCGSSEEEEGGGGGGGGAVRLKVKLPRSEVEKLMKESEADDEIVKKIRDICMTTRENQQQQQQQQMDWKNNQNGNGNGRFKAREVIKF